MEAKRYQIPKKDKKIKLTAWTRWSLIRKSGWIQLKTKAH